MTQHIPIFLASDDNYAPFVATTITSIVKNTKSFIDFYILDGGIVDFNKQKIESLKKSFNNFSIEFIDMSNSGLERFPNIAHYSVNTFSRYFIPDIKQNLDKILYLDVDIIVKGDIAELYNQDLENYPIGAILEDFYPNNYKYLKKICPTYNGGSNYFNAGVMLMSLKYFRENNLTQKLIDTTVELKDVLSCPDQDVFNFIFENNFKIIDYKFNFMPDHVEYIHNLGKKEAINAINNHVLLHYTSRKPWKSLAAERSDDFWEIAKLTPFYNQLLPLLKLGNINKIRIKYMIYKFLSKFVIGKTHERYNKKASMYNKQIYLLRNIAYLE